MEDFKNDIFDVDEEQVMMPKLTNHVTIQELEVVVGKMVDKRVKKLKKKHKRKEEELKKELKKAKKKSKSKNGKNGKKKHKDDDLLMKIANVSIEAGLPALFRCFSAKSQRDSKNS